MHGPTLTRLWFPVGQVLFGLWLFGCFPSRPPQWLAGGPSVDPVISENGLARALYLMLLTLSSYRLFVWLDTSRIRRRFFLRDLPAMLRLVLGSRRGAFILTVVAMHFVGMGAYLSRGEPSDSYFLRTTLVIVGSVLLSILLPPVAIVLASSSPPSGELLRTVAKHLSPLRVVSLLDGKYVGPRNWTSEEDNLRTILGHSWRSAVHRLIEITPVVIMDARVATEAVCEEIRHTLSAHGIGKTIFIVDSEGRGPGLLASGVVKTDITPTVCYAEEVLQEIDKVLSAKTRSHASLRKVPSW